MVARCYVVVVINIKSLIMGVPVTLETRLKGIGGVQPQKIDSSFQNVVILCSTRATLDFMTIYGKGIFRNIGKNHTIWKKDKFSAKNLSPPRKINLEG